MYNTMRLSVLASAALMVFSFSGAVQAQQRGDVLQLPPSDLAVSRQELHQVSRRHEAPRAAARETSGTLPVADTARRVERCRAPSRDRRAACSVYG